MSGQHRPKGTGSVRNRGSDRAPRWFAYYFVKADGKRRQISKGPFRRKAEAEAWLKDELKRRQDGRATMPGRFTVAEVLDQWLAAIEPRVVQSTLSEYRRQVEYRLKPYLGEIYVQDLGPDHIQLMLEDLRQPGSDRRSHKPKALSETTLQHTLQALRTALEWACLLYTSPSPRDRQKSRMPSSA